MKKTECQVFHISTVSTRLSAIKVQQNLDNFKNETNNESAYRDNYIFIRLRSLLLRERQAFIMKAFREKGTHNLFVIECQNKNRDNHKEECLIKELLPILQKISFKKLIFIENGCTFRESFEKIFESDTRGKKIEFLMEEDKYFFKNLTDKSKGKILEKECRRC